ncbi:Penicillin-binding protein transpeptidase [Nostocoides japonicum T1-X7]|uniref:Penicillin-binding protein transpeptidase n=1 Tax=Nostocoides japonicum T1-X7 TaxID=1194083 RepID=A0A077LZB1_9MICO|nr:penicillin-binding transpeptidase domain-containing protein [Tetrasphaera japonica]CCH79243.1 Penicillin-binding protein transpeptidase [Tetrasphaera japonica T1-X7]
MSRRWVAAIVAVVLVIAVGAGGGFWWWHREQQKDDAARAVLTALAAGWAKKSLTDPAVPFQDTAVRDTFRPTFAGMGSAPVTAKVDGFSRSGDAATATIDVSWKVSDDRTWTYRAPFGAAYDGTHWVVTTRGTGSPWVPGIAAEDTVSLDRVWGARGDILADDGTALMPMGEVYPVQLDPTRATAATARALEKLTDQKAGSLVTQLAKAKAAGSQAPIPVITYRKADFDKRRDALDALKGVIYPKTEQPLARTRTFGQPLLGSFGPVTAEMVEKGDGRYAASDRAGTSGLQGQYDAVLGGTPGIQVTSSTGKVLSEEKPVDGKDIRTSLRPAVQEAAEKALASTGSTPSALVAVDVRSGHVVAVANNPELGFDRALTGQYPPGSTMKVATTYALLTGHKATPATRTSCPKTYTVDGRAFHNFEGESLGTPTLQLNFAHSCNTAFIQLGEKLDNTALRTAAKALGLGGDWGTTLGVDGTYAGSVPVTKDGTDHAASVIGQGRVLASPVAMAVLAGSVARGSFISPTLVQSPSTGAPAKAVALNGTATAQIRTMMRLVVTEGTGTALKGVPGGAVHGKTGTAEYGTGATPKNRVWFIGYQGGLAFAVMVEDGSSGGTVAGPVAAKFLTDLAATS